MAITKELIKQFIYFVTIKKVGYKELSNNNKEAFKDLETRFFASKEVNNLSFKQFNTICYIIGDYLDNRFYNTYESQIIKECLQVVV